MEAIICSAGKGSRLGPMGFYMRKSMFRDLHTDKTILWYQLDALHELGVSRVVILYPRGDWQIPAEVHRIRERFPGMQLCCVPVQTHTICETVKIGLSHTTTECVIRLDGDVCIPERTGLLPFRGRKGNHIAYFRPPEGYPINEHTFIITEDDRIAYWKPSSDASRVWCCIEMWNRRDLERIVAYGETHDGVYIYRCINDLSRVEPALECEWVQIPAVYEIDTPGDIQELVAFWDSRTRDLERRTLAFWQNQEKYPAFSCDKRQLLELDIRMMLERIGERLKIIEIGAAEGHLMKALIERKNPLRYRAVEPNPHWVSLAKRMYEQDGRVCCFEGTLEEWNDQHRDVDDCDDVAIALGWAIYIVHDETLHRNLFGLKARRLILKASEPPQDRYLRLLVDQYSPEVGEHYVALYRSVSEMCNILRHAGWLIRDVQREIYPAHLDSRYGNRAYLIDAERP